MKEYRYRNRYKELHREDGPAVIYPNGNKLWYLNGKLHRENGPAIEHVNGNKRWYLNGKKHREDGPAVELVHGYRLKLIDGKDVRGYRAWYQNDVLHREDGPAIVYADGREYFYLHGVSMSEEEFNLRASGNTDEDLKAEIHQLRTALSDVIDGMDLYDIQCLTGLSDEKCHNILKLVKDKK